MKAIKTTTNKNKKKIFAVSIAHWEITLVNSVIAVPLNSGPKLAIWEPSSS